MISFFIEKNQEGKLDAYSIHPDFCSKFFGQVIMFFPEGDAIFYLSKPEGDEDLGLEGVMFPPEIEPIILERWTTQNT